jgi:hypothetical protein
MTTRIARPQKTFDDQLERLIAHLSTHKLSLPGVDAKALEADLKAQRDERQSDMELFARYVEAHQRFLLAQSERYARYMRAVKILRAAHGDDPAGLRGLDQFKRPRTGKRGEPAPTPAPLPPTPAPLPDPGLTPAPTKKKTRAGS